MDKKVRIKRHVVGNVINDTYYKTVRGSLFFVNDPPMIPLDYSEITDAENFGAKYISIMDLEDRNQYVISIEKFRNNGHEIIRMYGKQFALQLDQWNILKRSLLHHTPSQSKFI